MDQQKSTEIQQPIPEIVATNEQQTICSTQVFPVAGLQEVPEAVRVASQQIFQHQVTPTDANLPNSLQNIILNSNVKNSPMELQDSILANMRFLRNQGFKDGLALGLARFGLVNNNNNTSQNNNINNPNDTIITTAANQQQISMPVTPIANVSSVSHSNNIKQKSLLRKNRQTPTPFEMNVTTQIDPSSQNRLQQQFGDDLSKTFGNASLVNDKNSAKKPNFFLEEFKLVRKQQISIQ